MFIKPTQDSVRSKTARRRAWLMAAYAAASDPDWDADAELYINATGELFPDALNTLVLGIKAAGLWDDHIGSIKKAIGVPNLAASLIDLRNPAFNGSAPTPPTHSATEGWGFTAASSQYIDSGWQCGATDSKGSQDSVHVSVRIREFNQPSGAFFAFGVQRPTSNRQISLYFTNNEPRFLLNDNTAMTLTIPSIAPIAYVAARTAVNDRRLYTDGDLAQTVGQASIAITDAPVAIGARNNDGTPQFFFTGRISLWHAGAGLDDTQAATLTSLFDAYATAAGEA